MMELVGLEDSTHPTLKRGTAVATPPVQIEVRAVTPYAVPTEWSGRVS